MSCIVYTGNPPEKEISQIFCETMGELIENDKDVIYIDADLMASMKSKLLWERYPNNVVNTGIQEANMIGVAAGMYLTGRKVYVHSFAPFASRRCYDQIYVSIGYAQKGIRIIGSEPGICATDNGGTHMTFEDIALMRAIPGSTIIDISDARMFEQLLYKTQNMNGVIYFRTPRRGLPDIYGKEEQFEIGKGKIIREGDACTVIASGIMAATAIEASKILSNKGIEIEIIDPVTIKPLDEKIILKSAMKTKHIVTVENHNIIGGLGGAVSEFICEKYPLPIKRIGIRDCFGQVGNEHFLREQYGLRAEDIVNTVSEFVEA